MSEKNKIPEFTVIAKEVREDAARFAANEAQKFFKNSFLRGGFTDAAFRPWKSRKSTLGGKKILYHSGALMQSIRPTEISVNRVVITSDTAYSEIHNSGGIVTVTAQMKKWWWRQYYILSGKVKKTKHGKASKSAANRKTNAKAQYCKNMALMKTGSKIKIPKRQFMGDSATMKKKFDQWLRKHIKQLPMTKN